MAGFAVGGTAVSHSGIYAPIIFAGKLLAKFYEATVFNYIANTDYEGEIKSQGDTVRIRTTPDVTIRDYVIGAGLTYEDLTPGSVDLVINKGKYYGVNIRRVQEAQSDIAFMDKWAEDASNQLKNKVDASVLAGIVDTCHASNKGATAGLISGNIDLGTTGAPLELDKTNIVDKIVEMGQVLDEQNIPDTDRFLVIPSWASTSIKTSELKDASLSGDGTSSLRNGRLGRIDRFTLYQSNALPHVTDGTKESFYLYAGNKASLTFASQLLENEVVPNQNDFGKLMRGLQVFGYKNILPQAFVQAYATRKVA